VKLNWIVIGIGDITRKRVIPAIEQEPRSTLYGIVTRDARKAEAYPGTRAWTTLEEALDDAAVEAVYVASPVVLHAPQTEAALRAGKHVLCEKPVGMNYAEAESMAATASACRRLLGVAYYRRLFPKLLRTRELIDGGAIGEPVLVEGNCHSWTPPADRGWLLDPKMAGGGPLYDIGSHRIDAMNFLFGRPTKAMGMLTNAVHRLGVEDSATVLIEYAGGVRGIVDVRWNSRVFRDQFRVVGTEGEIQLDPLSGPELRIGSRTEHLPTHENVHYPAVENFVSAVLDGAPLACPVDEAIWTDWVTEAAARGRVR
jgi:predicted dehydrogenase